MWRRKRARGPRLIRFLLRLPCTLLQDEDVQRRIVTVRVVCAGLMLSAAVLAPMHGSSQADAPPQLQARLLGDGAPVVLLGGGLLGADGWGEVPHVLAKTRRVLNLQSLAVQYGLENRSLPAGYSIQTEVDALGRTLDAMRAGQVDVIGMSHGGVVAIVFALQSPHRVRTLTLVEPPAFWVLPNHGRDTEGAREMQALLSSLQGRTIEEEHLERFRCLLGDCMGGRSPRLLSQWPQWVKYRHSLRGLYTVGDYDDDPARLRGLRVPALVVTGAKTAGFHRTINDTLLRALPRAERLELGAGHNSPTSDPARFVDEWQTFQERSGPATRSR
jgi:pimeloyl-ACP methyl ester carboxylesterase